MMGGSAVILLLNKHDLFIQKLRQKRIKDVSAFSEYRGCDMSAIDGVQYFLRKFMSQLADRSSGRVQHFVTNLHDTELTSKTILRCKSAMEMNRVDRGREFDPPLSTSSLRMNIMSSSNTLDRISPTNTNTVRDYRDESDDNGPQESEREKDVEDEVYRHSRRHSDCDKFNKK